MEAADWWARGLSIGGLVVSAAALSLTWRWRTAHDLLALHEALRKLKSAALAHLDAYAGEHPTERDVEDLLELAAYLGARAPSTEVREAARRVVEECRGALEPRVRERTIERKDVVRRAIREAFDSASATIGARADRHTVRTLVGRGRRAGR